MPLRLFTLGLVFILAQAVWAQSKEAVVFDIRRQVSLDPNKTESKDYYINSGSEAGLKQDMLIVVTRRHTLYDAYQNKSPGDLIVPVGQLRIIHVQKGLSVARLEKMVDREDLPNLELEAIMVGDRLDMETARMGKKKTAEVSPEPQKSTALESSGDFSSILPVQNVTIPLQTL